MAKIFPALRRNRWHLYLASTVVMSAFSMASIATLAIAQDQQEADKYYSPRSDWSTFSRGDLNISGFVYRDRNRNGVYDLGDRPMAAIAFEMTAPEGEKTVNRSNVNGFANFRMSVTKQNAEVTGPGEHHFRVIVPPGWFVTSDNGEQTSGFEVLTSSPADIVAKTTPPVPVGLAPELSIFGHVAARNADGDLVVPTDASISAVAPDGQIVDVIVDGTGTFAVPASEGVWRLTARQAGTNAWIERKVSVNEAPVRLSTLVFGDTIPAPARHQTEIDFENVSKSVLAKIPSGVGGVDWLYLNVTEMLFYNGPGYVNSAISGGYVAYNSSGHPVTISSKEGFDFVGAYFGIAWRTAEGEELLIKAWRNGELVGEEAIRLSSLGPVWFDAEYRDINKITLTTRHYWQFVTDDMIVRTKSKNRLER